MSESESGNVNQPLGQCIKFVCQNKRIEIDILACVVDQTPALLYNISTRGYSDGSTQEHFM